MSHQPKHLYEFGPFRLDVGERLLLRDGESVPLTPKSFDLLLALVEHHGHLLEKDELMKLVWPDTFVEEANLSYNISLIRKALGDGENGHRYIETAPKRGYRFVARVRKIEAKSPELNVGASGSSVSAQSLAPVRSRRWLWFLAGIGLLAVVALVAFLIGRRVGSAQGGKAAQTPPSFQRLTFRLGNVWSARFAPDGQTIIYGATWEGDKHQLYQTRPESQESRQFGTTNADILAISSLGEMALALQPSHPGRQIRGTLARMSLAGSAPRPILQDVSGADWAPDGTRLAVVRVVGGRSRIEFPLGASLYESNSIRCPRISPKGDLIAFIEGTTIAVVDLTGKKKTLSSGWRNIGTLAWSPGGDEVWFTASEVGFKSDLYAVTLTGEQRVVLRAPDVLNILDVSHDGRVLLRREYFRKGMMGLPPGEKQERDLSWLDWGHVNDLSNDGKTLVFSEGGEGGGFAEPGGGGDEMVYIRKTDGSPAVRVGEGRVAQLSPDEKWLAGIRQTRPFSRVTLLPTGVGEAKILTDDQIHCQWVSWFPDGKRILIVGNEQGHGVRNYIRDLAGGKSRPITPEGIAGKWISPDGQWIIVSQIAPGGSWRRAGPPDQPLSLFPVAGGEARPIPGLAAGDEPLRWCGDGRSIFVRQKENETARMRVYRLDLATGRRELLKEYVADPSQIAGVVPMALTPDGKSYVYTYVHNFSDLYLVKGLK